MLARTARCSRSCTAIVRLLANVATPRRCNACVPNLIEMEKLARKYQGRLNLIALNVEKNPTAALVFAEQHKLTAG